MFFSKHCVTIFLIHFSAEKVTETWFDCANCKECFSGHFLHYHCPQPQCNSTTFCKKCHDKRVKHEHNLDEKGKPFECKI
jgi:hypothetical protein